MNADLSNTKFWDLGLFHPTCRFLTESSSLRYQSLVTTAPTGRRIAGILTFLFVKPRYMPSTFCGQRSAQIPAGKMLNYLSWFGITPLPPLLPQFQGIAAQIKTWHLRHAMSPAIYGPGMGPGLQMTGALKWGWIFFVNFFFLNAWTIDYHENKTCIFCVCKIWCHITNKKPT